MSNKKKNSDFEIIYNEFPNVLTENELEKMLDHILDIKKRTLFWLLGIAIPLAILTYQVLEFTRKFDPANILIYSILISIMWIVLALHYRKTLKEFDIKTEFRAYLTIKQKLHASPNNLDHSV